MPDIAVLEPSLTAGLPPHLTAATGIDAFTHCLEAYFVNAFHPLADGIAQEGMRLVLAALPKAYVDGNDLEARGQMQMAAVMGATAFQKGLGMIHSLAHPLSARYNTHHGLANAILLPAAIEHLEDKLGSAVSAVSAAGAMGKAKFERVLALFHAAGFGERTLADSARSFFTRLKVPFGLRNHHVPKSDLDLLAQAAIEDSCHATNMIPISRADMLAVYSAAW